MGYCGWDDSSSTGGYFIEEANPRLPKQLLTPNMLNCLEDYKIYSNFDSYLGFGLTQVDEINSGITMHVVCSTQQIPCLLMFWWLEEPGHQQVRYWPPKPEYSSPCIRRVKIQWRISLTYGNFLSEISHSVLSHYWVVTHNFWSDKSLVLLWSTLWQSYCCNIFTRHKSLFLKKKIGQFVQIAKNWVTLPSFISYRNFWTKKILVKQVLVHKGFMSS